MENSGNFDDFELEVTDLHTGQRKHVRLELLPARILPRWRRLIERDAVTPVHFAQTAPTAPGARRPLPLNRPRLISAAVLVVLLLITAVVLGSDPGTAAALSAVVRLPFTTHTTPPDPSTSGEGSFVALDGVPWGTLLLDGRPDPRANTHLYIYQGSVTLPPGQHILEYRAAPFSTLRCVVTVPADEQDTCPLISQQQAGTLADPFPPATRLLDLHATPGRLPPAQQGALVAAIQAALAVRVPAEAATVLPGERYVTASGSVATATQPLRATYLYEFQWNSRRGLRGCSSLCTRHSSPPPYTDVWVISAHVRQGWRYTTPDGTPVVPFASPIAADIAPLTPSGASAPDIFVHLYVRWTGSWQVSTLSLAEYGDPYATPTCTVGFEALLRVMGSADVSFTPIPSSSVANGFIFRVQRYNSKGGFTGQSLYYFFRFGVLLAVNAAARSALPALPAASPAVQALARVIATQAGQPSP